MASHMATAFNHNKGISDVAAYGVNNSSVDNEEAFLLGYRTPTPIKRKKVRYRLNWLVKSKCACVIIVMVGLVHVFDPTASVSDDLFSRGQHTTLLSIYSGCSVFFYLFYPITGLYADIKFERYRTGISALCLAFVSCLSILIGIVLYEWGNSTAGFVLFSFGYICGKFAQTAFSIVMLSLGADQLIGVSSEELSAYVQWFYLSEIVGWCSSVPVTCLLKHFINRFDPWIPIFGLHTICILICLLIMILCKKVMVTERPRVNLNPVTLIVKVLKYAKSHRYPSNRSALTYWEEDYPSRIDFSKKKYGGPFTEEQVQDVKTLLKITPLIFCMLVFYVLADGHSFFSLVQSGYGRCLLSSVYFRDLLMIVATILFHVIVLYPIFHKCYPSMLKRIGFGIFLCVIASCLWWVLDIGSRLLSPDNKQDCLLNNDSSLMYEGTSYSFMLVPSLLQSVAFGIVGPTSLEFAFAQAPYSMRGVVIGLWYMSTGISRVIGSSMLYPFGQIKNLFDLPCEFYLFGTRFIIMFVTFICFVGLSLWYKLRFRGDRFDQYQAVRKSYSNYLERASIHNERIKQSSQSNSSNMTSMSS